MSVQRIIKLLWIGSGIVLAFVLLLLISIYSNLFGLFGELPSTEVLENPKSEVATEVYSSDAVLLGKYYHNFNRSPEKWESVPKVLCDALVATEDVRFYEHSGVDVKGIAVIIPSLLMGKRRGSSTLTQQLAKNLFKLREAEDYSGTLEGTFIDKIKEWFVAIQLERSYTKQEIMLMYLNTVDFGNNAFGIKNAAKKYFSKQTVDLSLHECALLIGMLKGPSVYNPRRNAEKALLRRNTVLKQMEKYGYITEEIYSSNSALPLQLKFNHQEDYLGMAPHFLAYIKPELKKWCKANGKKLYEDGLKIYTTIDSRMQKYAEQAVVQHMQFLQGEFEKHWAGRNPWTDANYKEIPGFAEKMARKSPRYLELKESEMDLNENEIMEIMNKPVRMRIFTYKGSKDTSMSPIDSIKYHLRYLHTGFLSMEPSSGHIKAWVGDVNFNYFKFDHVRQGYRQPGSTFKPLLYSYVMELKNLNPDSKVMDAPVSFVGADGKVWTPKNSDGKYSNDYLTLRQALAKSVNSVSAFLLKQVGPDSLVQFAKRMGIKSNLEPYPTICLGVNDVNIFDMVSAYAVFLNEGTRMEPQYLMRIDDKYGNTLERFSTTGKQILSEETASNMIELLKGSVEEEGGTSVALKSIYNISGDVGGKTGTTQGSSDGWFMGISPNLVTGVWVGGEERSIRFRSMQYGQGARMALPIFGLYLQKVYADRSLAYPKFFKKFDPSVILNDSTGLGKDSIPDSNPGEGDEEDLDLIMNQ